jgi:hypothetical protein
MLSHIYGDAAMPARALSGTGASFGGGCVAVPRERALLGDANHAAGQAKVALQQRTSQKYARTTRIAAAGGGAVGPHQAWDPV